MKRTVHGDKQVLDSVWADPFYRIFNRIRTAGTMSYHQNACTNFRSELPTPTRGRNFISVYVRNHFIFRRTAPAFAQLQSSRLLSVVIL